MGPKSPFLPLFFVNYWKFFQKIFFAFSPLFRPELLRKSRVSERKCTRFRVFQMRFFTHISSGKCPSGKQFSATMFLTKTGFAVIMFLL